MSLVLREIKGSKLTFAELDGNFTYLESLVGVTDVTYSELVAKITANELIEGALYKITDFKTCYDQPDYDFDGNEIIEGNWHDSDTHSIIVRAIATNKISDEAWQPDFPNDQIRYDYTYDETEVTGGTAYGRITERIDEFGNRTDYDHRTIKFKRYFSYGLDDKLSGWIYQVDGSSVYGVDTDFEADLNEGDIVFIPSPNSNGEGFYKVTSIVSATELQVQGHNYYNFNFINNDRGIQIWRCVLDYENLAGTLYLYNGSGAGNIDDGGNDMYDGGNYLNTNLASEIPYTHTQMSGVSGEATLPDFIIDGAVSTGLSPSVFGDAASYFTNHYPGLFVMVATDCNIYEFYTSGNNGADGGGSVTEHTYSKTVGGNNYKAFIKKIGDGGFDPSINQIIIVNTDGTGITHSYSSNTNDGEQRVEGLNDNGVTQVHYLLIGLAKGVRITNAEAEAIVDTYLGLVDGKSIDAILATLNTDYSNITDCVPARQVAANSYHYRQSNVIDNTGFTEVATFEQVNAVGNWIGDFAKYKTINGHTFLLSNNVFGKVTSNSDCEGNYFSDECYNNSIGGHCRNNQVAGGFSHNVIYYEFYENTIGYDCSDNALVDNDFYRNEIGTDFYSNVIVGQVWRNDIGNDCNNNIILQDFQNNHIMNQFNNNKIIDDFYKNTFGNGANNNYFFLNTYGNNIGNGYNDNIAYADLYDNIIGEYFNNNALYSKFYKNSCLSNFENNTIGELSEIKNYDFYQNTLGNFFKGNALIKSCYKNMIGDNFYSNIGGDNFRRNAIGTDFGLNNFGSNFEDNNIGNNFVSNGIKSNFINNEIANNFGNNNIVDYFAYNKIANDFSGNVIKSYFGFGGASQRGNIIGNYFRSNNIQEYFYDNDIRDSFTNNTIGENFQYNSIRNVVSGVNFTQNLGNILTVSYGSPSGADGVYSGVTSTTSGIGTGATFDITVVGGVVTSAIISVPGTQYAVSDTVTVAGSLFGGVDGVDDLTLTVLTISDTPAVYTTANCDIFRQSDGSLLLQTYETGVGLRFINPVDAL